VPIITVSRGSYSKGREIAEKVAERLGYRCVSRDEIQDLTSQRFGVPGVKLQRAIHDAPTLRDQLGYRKEKYVACVQAVTLREFGSDDVVYHGLAGHFLVQGVSHVLKVRILADLEDRVRWEMEREHVSEKEAIRVLERNDDERRRWSLHLYGIDTSDPRCYDLVLHIHRLTVDDAVGIICHTAGLPCFAATEESRRALADLALAAEVRVALVDLKPDVEVSSSGGAVTVRTTVSLTQEAALVDRLQKTAGGVPGVKSVVVGAHSALLDV
jgi:cytidylate kinase